MFLGNHPVTGAVTAYELETGKSVRLSGAGVSTSPLACSPDGRWIANGDYGGQVFIRSMADWKPIATSREHFSAINRLAFSADGRRLASGGQDGSIVVWDVAEGKPLLRLKGHAASICLLGFSPDGFTLVSGDLEGRLKVWDSEKPDGIISLDVAGGSGQDLTLTPDGRRMITAGRRVQSWDLADRNLLRTFELRADRDRLETNPSLTSCSVTLSRDGSQLAIGDSESRITIRELSTGRTLHQFQGVASEFYGPPSTRIAGATPSNKRGVASMAFSPDGTLLAAGFGIKNHYIANYDQVIKIFSLRSGCEVRTLGTMNTVPMVQFTGNGKTLVAASEEGTVMSWDVATWRPAGRTSETTGRGLTAAALSPDERLLAAGRASGAMVLWERATGREIRSIQAYPNWISHLAFSPDGRTLAATSPTEQTLTLWEVPGLRELHRQRTPRRMNLVTFSPAGDMLITAELKGVLLWPALSLAEIDAILATEAAQIRHRDQLAERFPRGPADPQEPARNRRGAAPRLHRPLLRRPGIVAYGDPPGDDPGRHLSGRQSLPPGTRVRGPLRRSGPRRTVSVRGRCLGPGREAGRFPGRPELRGAPAPAAGSTPMKRYGANISCRLSSTRVSVLASSLPDLVTPVSPLSARDQWRYHPRP